MRSLGSIPLLLVFLPVLLPFAGCNDSESGTLTVQYRLGPSSDAAACEEFGVNRVRATLGEGDLAEEAECGQDILFTAVDAGGWDIRVDALAADGTTVMDNEGEDARVEIRGGDAATYSAQLTETPARVYLRWALSLNNFQADCQDDGVETAQFQVQAWDEGAALGDAETFDCLAPDDPDVPTYVRLDDAGRQIRGTLLTDLTVTALDGTGMALDPAARFEFDTQLGPGRRVYLTVECNDNVCMPTGSPPWDTP